MKEESLKKEGENPQGENIVTGVDMKIVFVYADSPSEWNCSQWRSLTPSDAFNASDNSGLTGKLIHVTGFLDFLNPAIQDIVMGADLVIFQRNAVHENAFNAIQYFQGMGKPIVIDLDDAYHILPWSNPAHKFWLENEGGVAIHQLEKGLQISNGLIAPNRLLLSDWAHVCNGYYLPNFAEEKWWSNLPERSALKEEKGLSDRIIIGWGGSVSHYDSWWGSGIMDAAKAICQKYPEVVWMICGNDPRLYDALPVSLNNKVRQWGVEPSEWPKIVKLFDIGVAPLFGPYDQRRSWIKGLEYMLAGAPWVATVGEPYKDLMDFGKHIRNGADNWEKALSYLLDNLEKEQMYSLSRVPTAQGWFASNQYETYINIFKKIIQDATHPMMSPQRLPGVYYV